MNLNMTYKKTILTLLMSILWGCGSTKFVPTKDVCSLSKHWDDNLYQVKVNGTKINTHWYLKEDAVDVASQLAKDNKCMPF